MTGDAPIRDREPARLYWCPTHSVYTRNACQHRKVVGATGCPGDAEVTDLGLTLVELDRREVDAALYREMWDSGLIPPIGR